MFPSLPLARTFMTAAIRCAHYQHQPIFHFHRRALRCVSTKKNIPKSESTKGILNRPSDLVTIVKRQQTRTVTYKPLKKGFNLTTAENENIITRTFNATVGTLCHRQPPLNCPLVKTIKPCNDFKGASCRNNQPSIKYVTEVEHHIKSYVTFKNLKKGFKIITKAYETIITRIVALPFGDSLCCCRPSAGTNSVVPGAEKISKKTPNKTSENTKPTKPKNLPGESGHQESTSNLSRQLHRTVTYKKHTSGCKVTTKEGETTSTTYST